ncbi:MAG: hypothetical protein IPI11_14545 [Haliscomenobacter sp.]|nr:hypothetical protein [Haliscomenobacter sp.]
MFRKATYFGTSFFLGLVFFTAGMSKLYAEHRFPGLIGPVWLEERMAEYGLGGYARFIAFSQVVIGFVLLTLRYITAGALMLIPMAANILVITISLHWRGTPYILAVLLTLNLWLLFCDRKWLLPMITGKWPTQGMQNRGFHLYGHLVWLMGLAIALSAIPISYYHAFFGYVFVVCALLMAWMSPAADRMSRHG